jgi:hypothetical protein
MGGLSRISSFLKVTCQFALPVRFVAQVLQDGAHDVAVSMLVNVSYELVLWHGRAEIDVMRANLPFEKVT